MPNYKITAPDGNSYTVTAPEGATQDQVLAYAQANYQHPTVASGQPLQHADFSGVQGGVVPDPEKSTFQKVNDFGNNMGDAFVHHLANMPIGIAQSAAHQVKAALDTTAPSPGETGFLAQKRGQIVGAIDSGVNSLDSAIRNREASYQRNVPTNAASVIGATAGEVLPFVLDAPVKGVGMLGEGAAKLLTRGGGLASKVVSGATQGAILGSAQPVTGQGSFASQKAAQAGVGALVGGAIPAVSRAASEVHSLGQHVLSPQVIARNNLARVVGSDPATLAKLDAAGSTFPGVMPTTAQAAPSPSAVAAEKALGNTPYKAQMVARENQNNAVRVDALRGMAGDEATMQAAKDARSKAIQPFVNAHLTDRNRIDPTDVLDAIRKTQSTGLGARPTIRKALDDIASTIESSKDADGKVGADVLDSIRQNVNDFLISPNGKRASPQEALGVAPVRNKIIQTVGQHAPGYSDYLAAYGQHSTPINTMAAARAILKPVDNRALNSTGAAPLTLTDINRGLTSIDKGRYGVSPAAKSKLESLQQSLQQQGTSNSIRFPGSDTSYNVQAQGSLASSLLGPTLGGPTGKTRGIAALLGAAVGEHIAGPGGAAAGAGIGAFINKAADVVNKRIMDRYASGMLNPQEAATQIRAYLKANQKQAPKLLARYPQWAALLSSAPQKSLTGSSSP